MISPFIEGSQLDLHPLPAFLSVLIGAALLGLAGAALAIPAAAVIQVIAEEIVLPWYRGRIAPIEPERSA